MKTIEIIVSANGQSRVETKGFTGTECRDASRDFLLALGQKTDERLKPEFHQVETRQQQRASE